MTSIYARERYVDLGSTQVTRSTSAIYGGRLLPEVDRVDAVLVAASEPTVGLLVAEMRVGAREMRLSPHELISLSSLGEIGATAAVAYVPAEVVEVNPSVDVRVRVRLAESDRARGARVDVRVFLRVVMR